MLFDDNLTLGSSSQSPEKQKLLDHIKSSGVDDPDGTTDMLMQQSFGKIEDLFINEFRGNESRRLAVLMACGMKAFTANKLVNYLVDMEESGRDDQTHQWPTDMEAQQQAILGVVKDAKGGPVLEFEIWECTPRRFFRAFFADGAEWGGMERAKHEHTGKLLSNAISYGF